MLIILRQEFFMEIYGIFSDIIKSSGLQLTWLERYNGIVEVVGSSPISSTMGKIKIIKGDITRLRCDAIVNAANSSLLGGGGVDGAIHYAAGPELLAECRTLGGCRTGEAKITKGYKLPARFVIHTVGPIYFEHTPAEAEALLTSCYENSLNLAKEKELKTIASPLISAGVYGYPQRDAIRVAIETMKLHQDDFDEITLALFGEREFGFAGEMFPEFMNH